VYLCGPRKHNHQPFCGPEGRFYCSDSICYLWPTPFSYLCVRVKILGVLKIFCGWANKTWCGLHFTDSTACVLSFYAPPLHYISVPAPSISIVTATAISMGAYFVNLVVPEDTDTETVTNISMTVITEEMFDVHSAQIKWCWFYIFWNFISVVRFNVLSPFLIGWMFLCEPSWKYSAKLVGSELGQLFFANLIGSIHQSYIQVQKASLNMFWEHSPYWTIIASDWLRAELSCGWRKNKNKNGWQCC